MSAIARPRKNRFCVRQAARAKLAASYLRETTIMKLMKTLLTATAIVAMMAGSAYAKQLIYCSEASPKHFDPAMATGGNDFDASARTIYNRLVEFKHGETALEPGLADSWEISEDGLTYTFHLHPGTKFHTTSYFTPTRDLTADDVIFSFERQFKADNPFNAYLQDSQYEYYLAMAMPDYIESVTKGADDLTVVIKLKSPNSPMLANLGMDFASIVSKEYADQLLEAGTPELLASQPVGTGPFQFVDYQLDSVIRYAAFTDYFKGKVAIDDLIFAITPDTTARTQRLLAGECDIMSYPNPQDIASLQANADLTVLSQAGLNIGYMSYNTTVAPTDDVEVRKALSMAINKPALVEALFGPGNAEPAKNLIPPTMWSYNTATPEQEYNPDKAREILAAKGVTEIQLWASDRARSYNPSFARSAEIIQQDWAAVGVTATIHTVEWTQYRIDGALADRPGAFQIGWGGDNGDPDNFFAVLFGAAAIGTQNYSIWNNPEFEELIKAGVLETDPAKRTEIYMKAQEVMTREEPAFLMAHSTIYMPMNKKVIGYTMDPLAMHRFDNVDVAE
jgi:dipeptide transport system substrate-binding protein